MSTLNLSVIDAARRACSLRIDRIEQLVQILWNLFDPSFLDPNDDLLQRQLASCFFLYPDPGPQKRNPRFVNGSCKDIFWLNAGFFIFFKIVPQFKPEFVNFV